MQDRRKFLVSVGTVGTIAIAGCSGDTESESTSASSNEEESIDSSEEEQSESDSVPTHEIGDSFTVGDGDQTVEYIVNSASTANAIGGEYTQQEANGIYLIVELEMTNQTGETIDVSSNHLKAVDSEGNQFDADTGAGIYLSQDSRFDTEGISFEQLNPGLSVDGAVIFDVAPGAGYGLLVEPVGFFSSANPHLVTLGNIEG